MLFPCADILAADRQLATEIEFDLRRFEEEQAAEASRQKEAAAVAAATHQSPRRVTIESFFAMGVVLAS